MGHEGAEAPLLVEDQQGDLLVVSGHRGFYGERICGLYKPVERDDKGSWKYQKMDRDPLYADTWLLRDAEGYKIVHRDRLVLARCTDGATTDDGLLQSKGSWLARTTGRRCVCWLSLAPDPDLQVGRFQMSHLEKWRGRRQSMSRSAGESSGGSFEDELIDFSTHLRKEAMVWGAYFLGVILAVRATATLPVIAAAAFGGHGLYLFLTYRQTWSLEKHVAIAGVSCEDADVPAVCFLPSQAIGLVVLHAVFVALSVSVLVQSWGNSWKLSRITAQWLIDGRLLNRVVVRESAGLDMNVDGDSMLLGKVCVMGAQDWFMMFLKLGLLVFNVYSIIHRFRSLPQRDPEHRLNEALHFVSWSEVIVVGGIISEIVLMKAPQVLFRLCKLNDRNLRATGIPAWFVHLGVPDTMANARAVHYGFAAFGLTVIVTDAKFLSSWSALKLITLLDSSYLVRVAKVAFEWPASYGLNFFLIKAAAAAIWVSMTIFLGSLGVLAFNCHLLKVAFVTEKLYSDWTLSEWMSLVALVNNIAGLHDLDAVKTRAALYTLCRNKKDLAETERRVTSLDTALMAALLQRYGVFWAAALYFSHNADRWGEILLDMPDDFKWSAKMPDYNRGYGSP